MFTSLRTESHALKQASSREASSADLGTAVLGVSLCQTHFGDLFCAQVRCAAAAICAQTVPEAFLTQIASQLLKL